MLPSSREDTFGLWLSCRPFAIFSASETQLLVS
jgi:hypothetical protein